jgi:hypothetical protein
LARRNVAKEYYEFDGRKDGKREIAESTDIEEALHPKWESTLRGKETSI